MAATMKAAMRGGQATRPSDGLGSASYKPLYDNALSCNSGRRQTGLIIADWLEPGIRDPIPFTGYPGGHR